MDIGPDNALLVGGIGTCFWTFLYIIVLQIPIVTKLPLQDELDVRNRVVSIAHGLFLCFACGYEFFFLMDYKDPNKAMTLAAACGEPNNNFENFIFTMSSAYFLYDFLAMAYYNLLDWAMTVHHFASIIGMMLTLFSGNSGYLLICGMFIGEVSNAFMHVRVILRHFKMRYTLAYEASEISFLVLYIIGELFDFTVL